MFTNYPILMGYKYVLTCIYMPPTCKRLNLIYCINFGLQRNPPEEPVDTAKLNSVMGLQ